VIGNDEILGALRQGRELLSIVEDVWVYEVILPKLWIMEIQIFS
jgi:hypothetical protein